MRNAETTLEIIRDRGERRLPLERVYRLLYNPEMYLRAYGQIYQNKGAMTAGTTTETVDRMFIPKIMSIIDVLRSEQYRWKPVRRVYIEKRNSKKKRPLGLPVWSDKLLQEVIRSILEAYYESQFSQHSHGFHPNKGCHTALSEIKRKWTGTRWFIEADICKCFDSLDHNILMSILQENMKDNRFLRLIQNLLSAGYLEEWKFNSTLSGVPQGGIVSPILTNIYLNKLDQFIENVLMPRYNKGMKRKKNPEYEKLRNRKKKLTRQGKYEEAKQIVKKMQQIPSYDPNDEEFRRLRYVRYSDDFLLGFSGPREEAEEIKQQLSECLQMELKQNLSEAKTLISHARTEAAQFLGYEVGLLQNNQKLDKQGRRSLNGRIGLKIPRETILEKCKPYLRRGKPIHRAERLNNTVYSTIMQYQLEYRGIVEYFRLAFNLHRMSRLRWIMERSLVNTLAHKLKIKPTKVYKRYSTNIYTDHGMRKVLQVKVDRENVKKPLVAQWDNVSLAWNKNAHLNDQPLVIWNGRNELIQRLLADECELCGSTEKVEVHHIQAMKDLDQKEHRKPEWVKIMAARNRKTLVVCYKCHDDIHAGRLSRGSRIETLESRMS